MPAVTRICAWKYKDSVTKEKQHEMLEGLMKVYEELKHTTRWTWWPAELSTHDIPPKLTLT